MKSTWPGRSSAISCGCGSFTLTISSAAANTVGAIGGDAPARRLVGRVVEADAGAGASLDHHLVAVMDEFAHAAGHQADAVLVRLDLLGDADQHQAAAFSTSASMPNSRRSAPWR